MVIGFWLAIYVAAAFLMSAAVVRVAPRSRAGRRLRTNLALFPLLPLMLVAVLPGFVVRAAVGACGGIERLFVRLSGRPQYKRVPYGHFGYYRTNSRQIER